MVKHRNRGAHAGAASGSINSELDEGSWSPSVNFRLIYQFVKMPREMESWGGALRWHSLK
jgi:hypothetical protein